MVVDHDALLAFTIKWVASQLEDIEDTPSPPTQRGFALKPASRNKTMHKPSIWETPAKVNSIGIASGPIERLRLESRRTSNMQSSEGGSIGSTVPEDEKGAQAKREHQR